MTQYHSHPPWFSDLLSAFALLTRLPVTDHTPRGAKAAWAWPIAGTVVGGVSGVVGVGLVWIGIPVAAAAGAILLTQVILTGALHEDGLADTADAFWGGRDRARRLEIMKDSRIGTYGLLALVFSVGLRWTALATLLVQGHGVGVMIAAAALSRAAMVWPMATLPPARPGGLSAGTGQPGRGPLIGALVVAGLCALLVSGAPAVIAGAIAVLPVLWLARIMTAKIGGQTGDTLGATQQVTEVIVLLALAALLS